MSTATRPRVKKSTASRNGTAPAAIVIPPRCKPSRVCSPDYTRPILQHAYLRNREDGLWLLATDSYIAAAIKIDGTAPDGFIPIGALRLMEAGQHAERISESAWRVSTKGGLVTFDIAEVLHGKSDYPNFDNLGMWDTPEESKTLPSAIGLNPSLMTRLAAGLGARYGCRFDVIGELKAVRVTPLSEDGRLGLQMPIRMS